MGRGIHTGYKKEIYFLNDITNRNVSPLEYSHAWPGWKKESNIPGHLTGPH